MHVQGPKKQRDLLLNLTINHDGCTVVSNKAVKDLGVTLDPDLSLDEHIKTVSRTAVFHLRNAVTLDPDLYFCCSSFKCCACGYGSLTCSPDVLSCPRPAVFNSLETAGAVEIL
jgi:hypothetical protein